MNTLIVIIITQTVVYLLAITAMTVELHKVQRQRRTARDDAMYWYARFARQCSREAKDVARAYQTGVDTGRDLQAKEDAARMVLAETTAPTPATQA